MSEKKIAIINYGMGNLNSVCNAFSLLGASPVVTAEPEEIQSAAALVLPGVGAFGEAVNNLRQLGLVDLLTGQVIEKKVPFLGICLGMQLIAESSTENGFHQGLGWIKGSVDKLEEGGDVILPHVGWNTLSPAGDAPLLNDLAEEHFYYVHTYAMTCPDDYVIARCDYGGEFVCAVRRDNIYGVQFHPEKSSKAGAALLKNFLSC